MFNKIKRSGCRRYLKFLIIDTGEWPKLWKTSLVCPIPKNRNVSNDTDFSPIGLLPVMSKVLEVIINDQMITFINQNDLNDENQSGFKKYHSITTALLKITDSIRMA